MTLLAGIAFGLGIACAVGLVRAVVVDLVKDAKQRDIQ